MATVSPGTTSALVASLQLRSAATRRRSPDSCRAIDRCRPKIWTDLAPWWGLRWSNPTRHLNAIPAERSTGGRAIHLVRKCGQQQTQRLTQRTNLGGQQMAIATMNDVVENTAAPKRRGPVKQLPWESLIVDGRLLVAVKAISFWQQRVSTRTVDRICFGHLNVENWNPAKLRIPRRSQQSLPFAP